MEVNDKHLTDDQISDYSMNNAYLLLTNKRSLDDLLDNEITGVWIPVNPVKNYKKELYRMIDEVISYFEYTEEYEKCYELKELKDLYIKK